MQYTDAFSKRVATNTYGGKDRRGGASVEGQTKRANPKSNETGPGHPLYRRVEVPCLREFATMFVVRWYTPKGRWPPDLYMLALAPAGPADEERHARGA